MNINEMLNLWVKITNVNSQEQKASQMIHFDDYLTDYDIEKMNKKIEESLNYDPTGLFATVYLSDFFKQYIMVHNISLEEYLNNPNIMNYLENVKTLHAALQQKDVDTQIMEEAIKAMKFYNLKYDALSIVDIIETRTCAEKCIDDLELLQFRAGKTQNDNFKMNRDILIYKDINALITCAALGQVDGVSLAYIRNEEKITLSYFAFIIKNGENLYLLTDRPVLTHPLQAKRSRCSGREMFQRIHSNFFPYDTIANIDIENLWGNERYGTSEINDSSTVLTEYDLNSEALYHKIGTIDMLSQVESFWFVMMLSLIKKKFYGKDLPQIELSYTGNQIIHPMIEANKAALMTQSQMPTLTLSKLSNKDIQDLTYDAYYEEHLKSDWYQYILDRYPVGDDINVYNIMSDTEANEVSLSKKYPLYPFDIMKECDTAENIIYHQKWIARYNYAQYVQSLLEQDYDQNFFSLRKEIKDLMAANIENIVIDALRENLVDYSARNIDFSQIYDGVLTPITKWVTFDQYWGFNNWPKLRFEQNKEASFCTTKASTRSFFTNGAPGVVLMIYPKTTKALSHLCGCDVDDLPEKLQHWNKSRYYCGNSITNNIDPVASTLKDPFNNMDFSVAIILSKKEYMSFAAKAGVKVEKFWLK